MPYKISGTKSETARVIVLKESDWSIESNTVVAGSGSYEIDDLEAGNKTILSRTSNGWLKGYGNVVPIESESEVFREILGNMGDIYAGMYLTIGLNYDGTLLAVGSDDEGIVTAALTWTDVTQLASAGSWPYHFVALKSDGTVVHGGDNDYGEGDVGSWTDIVQVSVGYGATVGVKSDGTVVATGDDSYDEVTTAQTWTDIVQVTAADEWIVGLKSDGTCVAAGANWEEDWNSNLDVDDWTDIVQIAAGEEHVVGLKSDGTVVGAGSNLSGALDGTLIYDNYTFSNNSDGIVKIDAEGWANARDGVTGTLMDTTSTVLGNATGVAEFDSGTYAVSRAFFNFDLSGIPFGTTIIDAHLYFRGETNHASSCVIQEGTQGASLALGDFDSFTGSLLASQITWATSGNYFEFNEAGLTYLDSVLEGTAKFCLREYEHDYLDVAPGTSTSYYNGLYFSEHSASYTKPALIIRMANPNAWTGVNIINTGYYQTYAILEDGTVLGVGDEWGVGELSMLAGLDEWTDIIAIDGAEDHTVGLQSDGTVLTLGANDYGQRDTDSWRLTQPSISFNPAGGILDELETITLSTTVSGASMYYTTDGSDPDSGDTLYTTPIAAFSGTIKAIAILGEDESEIVTTTYTVGDGTSRLIAAGYKYTVGINPDGTVIGCGDESHDKRAVDSWSDIISLDALNEVTMGIKADRTVVATGDDVDGLDFSAFTDIVKISTGLNEFVGLTSSGTCVAVGDNTYGQCDVDDWTNIVDVSTWSGKTLGVTSSGTIVLAGNDYTDDRAIVTSWTDIVKIEMGQWSILGLTSSGTCIGCSTFGGFDEDVATWPTDIIDINSGYDSYIGLTSSGTVVAIDYDRDPDTINLGWTDIIQICVGSYNSGGFVVGLTSSGTLVSNGWNNDGENDFGDWVLETDF